MAVVSFVHTERRFRAQSYPVIAPGLHIKWPSKDRCVLGLSPRNLHATVTAQELRVDIRVAKSRRLFVCPRRWFTYHTARWPSIGPGESRAADWSAPDLEGFAARQLPGFPETSPVGKHPKRSESSLDVLVAWEYRPGVYGAKRRRGSEKRQLLRAWHSFRDGSGRQHPYWKLDNDE